MPSTKWKPIEDLPDNWRDLANHELETLPQAWANTRARLGDSEALDDFNERLKREWAIETGVIEDAYRIDRGTTQTLIEHGIKASLIPHDASNLPAEQLVDIITAQQDALEGVFSFVKQERDLGTSFIKELHSALLRGIDTTDAKDQFGNWIKVPLLKGEWKRLPNNPSRPDGVIHDYCPPEHVAAEMDRLIEMHRNHTGVPPEVESAWLHHRFTQVHPFQDGNGRVARAIASIVSIRAGWLPLLVRRQDIVAYIGRLEAADAGNLGPLVELFARRHIEEFTKAIDIAKHLVAEHEAIQRITNTINPPLSSRNDSAVRQSELTAKLMELAADRMRSTMSKLVSSSFDLDRKLIAMVQSLANDPYAYLAENVERVAATVGRRIDSRHTRSSVRLVVESYLPTSIVIAFTPYFLPMPGVAASAFIEFGIPDRPIGNPINSADVLSQQIFMISNDEHLDDKRFEFQSWVHGAVVAGLNRFNEVLAATKRADVPHENRSKNE